MFDWFSFLSYTFVTAVTPGPNTLSAMSVGGRLGFRRGLPFNLGIWLGFSVVMLLCTFLCSSLEALIPRIRLPMLILGAAYMLYLAWGTYKSAPLTEKEGVGGSFLSGLWLQFVNVKIYIYGIMSMEAYVLPYFHGRPGVLALFALLLAFIGFVFTLLWSLFGSVFRSLFSKHGKITNTVLALMLVYCALSLFL